MPQKDDRLVSVTLTEFELASLIYAASLAGDARLTPPLMTDDLLLALAKCTRVLSAGGDDDPQWQKRGLALADKIESRVGRGY